MRRRKAQPDLVPASAPAVPAPWPGLFLGASATGPMCAGPQHSALVLGPPRSGKTASVVVPCVLAGPGAVVSTSTKVDVLGVTLAARRRRGRCWLFDPSQSTPVPDGVTPLRWSPVTGCQDWNTAVATAHALVTAARPRGSPGESPHWLERAEALLGPLLHAAALNDMDVGWVLRWVLRRELVEPAMVIARRGGEMPGDVLGGIAATEDRERSGIFSTAANVLAAYRNTGAVAAAADPNFDPTGFVHSSDTVYICAPAVDQEQLAPLVVALLEQIRTAAYRRARGWPPVVWALDEVANIAPLRSLPAIVSEGGSQGLVVLASLQDLAQARERWGPAADGFLSLFGAKLLLPGIGDLRTLELVSALAGEMGVVLKSHTRATGWMLGRNVPAPTVTSSIHFRRRLPVDQVAQGRPGQAIAIIGPSRPAFVDLVPFWAPPWRELLDSA